MDKQTPPRFIPYGQHSLDASDIAAVLDVLHRGPLTQGPKIEEFEAAVAAYTGARYAVAVSSGTAALHLACLAADLGPGDHAVTTPNTFVATANAVLYSGAQPHFADIDPETLNLSAEALETVCCALGKVRAVLPVHFAGLPCAMPEIRKIADRFGACVIEDAAHALGAVYPQGGRVGNCAWSDMTIFSFHPVKLIAAGEGGSITTNDEKLYRRLLRLRSHGTNKLDDPFQVPDQALTASQSNPWYYEMQELGFNYRITDIQAALAISQFRRVGAFLDRRRQLALRYDRLLGDGASWRLVQKEGRSLSAHHLYVLRIGFSRLRTSRAELMSKLRAAGIGTQVHYIPVPFHPYYRSHGLAGQRILVAEAYYSEALTLPLHCGLSDPDQDMVVQTLRSLLR